MICKNVTICATLCERIKDQLLKLAQEKSILYIIYIFMGLRLFLYKRSTIETRSRKKVFYI